MLLNWQIGNFKSIAATVSLPLKPLTLLTGVNSAGKSSLIQSILLVAQTLQEEDPSIELNTSGELTNLGTLNEVWTIGAQKNPLVIGFTLAGQPGEDSGIGLEACYPLTENRFRQPVTTLTDGRLWLKRPAPGDGPAQAPDLQFSASTQPRSPIQPPLLTIPAASDRVTQEWSAYLRRQPWSRNRTDIYELKKCGVSRRHFLPRRFVAPLPAGLIERYQRMDRYLEPLQNPLMKRPPQNRHMLPDEDMPAFLRDAMADFQKVGPVLQTYHQYLTAVEQLNENDRSRLLSRIDKLLQEDQPELQVTAGDQLVQLPLPPSIEQAAERIYDFFVRKILYIGAVRVEPVLVASLNSSTTWGKYVGLHGEKLPLAIGRYEKMDIICPLPYEDGDQEVTLGVALEQWLHYLGLAEGVGANPVGRIGYQVRVSDALESKGLFDLGAVGLGISQALPILVNGLMMKPGGLLLIEQPEVHLHPRAQARLGDFFLALAASGRQVIVETHSDHLTNRILRRVAEDMTDQTLANTQIYFASRENGHPGTQFTPVTIDENGMVQDWPENFFDESAMEAQATLQAQLTRMRREKKQIHEGENE